MSGIGGLAWLDGRKDFDDLALLHRFASALRPYGATRQETLVSQACGLVYAHCAGSCIHDQAAAPATSADGRFRLVFDGRLDYREELVEQLGLTPDALEWTDARLAAESWSRWADDAPRHWYGEFAVIVWDGEQNQLFLVRDYLGMRSLSWHRRDDGLIVACTSPKPMFSIDGVPREADEQKIADQLLQMFHDGGRSFYRDIQRVRPATVMRFDASGHHERQYWSIDDLAMRPAPHDTQELVNQARSLFACAIRQCLRGARSPAAFMSGGLDSSAVAVTALDLLPAHQDLSTYTSVPSRDWDGRCQSGTYGDERPFVEAIARLHPRLKPRFTSSEGIGLFHLLDDFIDLSGVAPRNALNFCWLHDIREQAVADGHDVLLEGGMGNPTLSWGGEGALADWLRRGRFDKLVPVLMRMARRPRSLAWSVFNLLLIPALPERAAIWLRRAREGFPSWPHWYTFSAMRPSYFKSHGLQDRMNWFGWNFFATGTHGLAGRKALLTHGPVLERGDVSTGFRAIHRIDSRDPFCDRKLVEWCFSLPDEVFFAAGADRGFIRTMMAGKLPPEVLQNRKVGRQIIDWHVRMGWDMDRIRDEIEACADDPDTSRYIDTDRFTALLDNWPSKDPLGRVRPDTTVAYFSVAMCSALAAGRLVRRAKGSNR
jgi:asparagine synthase (glutamine-hydrolysing)